MVFNSSNNGDRRRCHRKMKGRGGALAALLAQTVIAGDVNACCGVLRRIFSESLQEGPSVMAGLRQYESTGASSPRLNATGVVSPTPLSCSVTTAAAAASPQSAVRQQHRRSGGSSAGGDVVNFIRYGQEQQALQHSFANAAVQDILHSRLPAATRTNAGFGEGHGEDPSGSGGGLDGVHPGPTTPSVVAQHSGPASSSSSAASRDTPLIHRIWTLARSCLNDDPSLVRHSSLYVLCHAAQRTGCWTEALYFSRHLRHPPSPLFLSSLLQPQNVHAVMQCCAERGWALDVPNAIRVLAQEYGSWSAALAIAQDAERRFPLGEVYSIAVLVPYLAASGETAAARQLFEAGIAQGALVDAALVQHLILQTATLRQWACCLHMLDCLSRTQETAQLLPSDVDFFRQLMELSPRWTTSLQLLHMARASEVKPDQRMIGILLTQCDNSGAWREAAAVYDMAVREDFIDSLAMGSTYHTLVRSFGAIQEWHKALEALSWMSKAGDASLTAGMCEVVTLCEQAGQWEAALAVGATLLESGLHFCSQETSLALLFACVRGAQWSFAMRLFAAQLRDVRVDLHPLSACAVMQACIAAQQWQPALSIYHEVQSLQPRVVVPPLAHRMAVQACVAGGRWNEVIAVLQGMQQDGLPLDNRSQRLGMWAAALQGNWELSLKYLQCIPYGSRTVQDRMIIRSTTRQISPTVNAIALKHLQPR